MGLRCLECHFIVLICLCLVPSLSLFSVNRQVAGSNLSVQDFEHFDFPTVVHDWVNKGLGMSSRVCATGHIKDPVALIEKSRASCPGGRFPSCFIHKVIITGLNKLHDCMFSP